MSGVTIHGRSCSDCKHHAKEFDQYPCNVCRDHSRFDTAYDYGFITKHANEPAALRWPTPTDIAISRMMGGSDWGKPALDIPNTNKNEKEKETMTVVELCRKYNGWTHKLVDRDKIIDVGMPVSEFCKKYNMTYEELLVSLGIIGPRVENKKEIEIQRVVFNDPATIVFWKDGTKTVVKCQNGEPFDPEKGLAMAIAKKVFGNKGNYNEIFKRYLPKEDESESKRG